MVKRKKIQYKCIMNFPNLPYSREELEKLGELSELGKKSNKQDAYLKGRCLIIPCSVNLCRYNMCYGIEKAFRLSLEKTKEKISEEDIFCIIKKSVHKQSHRIIEKYNKNEAKHLKRIEKERKLRTREANVNYKNMYAPENNWPKPITIKMETIENEVNLGIIKSENLESEDLSENLSLEVGTMQSLQNVNEFNSLSQAMPSNLSESIRLESEMGEILNDTNTSSATLNYDAFESVAVTSTQKDPHNVVIKKEKKNDIENSQVPCHNDIQNSEFYYTQTSYSYDTESILNKMNNIISDNPNPSQIIEYNYDIM